MKNTPVSGKQLQALVVPLPSRATCVMLYFTELRGSAQINHFFFKQLKNNPNVLALSLFFQMKVNEIDIGEFALINASLARDASTCPLNGYW